MAISCRNPFLGDAVTAMWTIVRRLLASEDTTLAATDALTSLEVDTIDGKQPNRTTEGVQGSEVCKRPTTRCSCE